MKAFYFPPKTLNFTKAIEEETHLAKKNHDKAAASGI
jgi:hypothetical protein